MPRKGGDFERSFCRLLSLWWTEDRDDDCFWRTSQSGGRATVRGRKGQRTRGHYGDVTATDSEGRPFTSRITLELKRGYNRTTITDLIDRPPQAKTQQLEEWIKQAEDSAAGAGTKFWMIVHRRDKREIVTYFPIALWKALDNDAQRPRPFLVGHLRLKQSHTKLVTVCCMTFAQWCNFVSPAQIRSIPK